MGWAHDRQRPRSSSQLSTGMLSYQWIGARQRGQCDEGVTTERSSGMRTMQTLRKLPKMSPAMPTRTATTTPPAPIVNAQRQGRNSARAGAAPHAGESPGGRRRVVAHPCGAELNAGCASVSHVYVFCPDGCEALAWNALLSAESIVMSTPSDGLNDDSSARSAAYVSFAA